MEINHRNVLDIDAVIAHYSDKDGVDIKYVCTSEIDGNNIPCDIFYRETPHPEYGNHYFGLFETPRGIYIGDADSIEKVEFGLVLDQGQWQYSRFRHDYFSAGSCAVDGGRQYFKRAGDLSVPTITMQVVDGQLVKKEV